MDKNRDVFQDEFTENQTKAKGAVRDDVEQNKRLDPNVDSQEADRAMAEDRFGQNEPKSKRD